MQRMAVSLLLAVCLCAQTAFAPRAFAAETGDSSIRAVAAGQTHSLFLQADGTVWGWGYNGYGQLGRGNTTSVNVPSASQLTDVSSIATGRYHTLAVRQGKLYGMGYNSYGQLGNGLTQTSGSPVESSLLTAALAGRTVKEAAAGDTHSLALLSDGTVMAWGQNNYGQLGNGYPANANTPAAVPGLSDVVKIAAGYYASFAVTGAGEVYAWGYNGSYGQLGDGTTADSASPIRIAGLDNVKDIAAFGTSSGHILVLKTDGTVWAWGYNGYGQLGNGTTANAKSPVQVAGLGGIVKLAAGDNHSLAIDEDGRVWAWGYNADGRLGDGTLTNRQTPVRLDGITDAVAVSAGGSHSLAVTADGRVWAWGENDNGQLGRKGTVDRYAPAEALFVPAEVHVEVSAPNGTAVPGAAVQLISDDAVVSGVTDADGNFTFGNLAVDEYVVVSQKEGLAAASEVVRVTGTAPSGTAELTMEPAGDEDAQPAVSAGDGFSMALKPDGSVYTWGYNGYSQLGTGDTTERTVPYRVLEQGTAIAAGTYHAAAVRRDGTVWTWGYNAYGQLGDGTDDSRKSPVQTLGIAGAVSIAVGDYHTLAAKDDGSVWAWGYNNDGQLGDGTKVKRKLPKRVSALEGIAVKEVAAGSNFSAALTAGGEVYVWGDNGYGQLGDGTTADSHTPKLVAGLSGVKAIRAAGEHIFALTADGSLYGWGENGGYSVLGTGDSGTKTTPTLITALSGVTIASIATGDSHSAAVTDEGRLWVWGYNGYGQLGDDTEVSHNRPKELPARFLEGAAGAAAGGNHTLAVATDGSLRAWGYNYNGQLGRGVKTDRLTPARVKEQGGALSGSVLTGTVPVEGASVTLVSEDGIRSATTDADGGFSFTDLPQDSYIVSVRKEGLKAASAQVPVGTSAATLPPFTLAEEDPVTAADRSVSAGYYYTLRLKEDGSVWSYGYNGSGQLGDGTYTERRTAVRVNGLGKAKRVAAGNSHSAAVLADGTVWMWGNNSYGQLGDGTVTARLTPVQVWGLTDVVEVALDDYFSLALKSDGSVWAWGYNHYGQLGDGTRTSRSIPRKISGSRTFKDIDAASDYALAVHTDGTLWAWGYNDDGQLDNAVAEDFLLTPQAIRGLSGIKKAAAGSYASFYLTDGNRLYGWGGNSYGTVGNGSHSSVSEPVQILFDTNGDGIADAADEYPFVASIEAGNYSSAAVDGEGKLWTWGYNSYGELGDSTTEWRNAPNPAKAPTGTDSVSIGEHHIAFVTDAASPWGVGHNGYGELGRGNTADRWTPVQAVFEPGSITVTVTGAEDAEGTEVALLSGDGLQTAQTAEDGTATFGGLPADEYVVTVRRDGYKAESRAADLTPDEGKSESYSIALTPAEPVSEANASIRNGTSHTVYLSPAGSVYTWGYNAHGQLGNGSTANVTAVPSDPVLTGVKAIEAGANFTLALRTDGTVWAWGYNGYGQLGNGTTSGSNVPVLVPGLTDVVAIAAGDHHAAALKSDGNVWTWGYNYYGQLGDGTAMKRTGPVRVQLDGPASAIAAGGEFTLAVIAGEVWGWGYNGDGELGDDSTDSRYRPVKAANLTGVTKISAGDSHSAAVRSDGTLWQWGYNGWGVFGNGNGQPYRSLVPVPSTTLMGVTDVRAGNGYTLALAGGSLYGMGYNGYGQLGDGTTGSRNAPVAVSTFGAGTIKSFDASAYHSAAIGGGDLFTWGYNGHGELGDGTTIDRKLPVQVGNGAPSVPVGLQVAPGNGKITLSWTPNGEPDLSGYRIYWKPGSAADYSAPVDVPARTEGGAAVSSYEIGGLTNDLPYEFAIAAVDATSLESTRSAAVTATPSSGLVAPGGITATPGDGVLVLSWAPVDGADGYEIFVDDVSAATVSGVSHTLSGLTNDTGYRIQIRSYAVLTETENQYSVLSGPIVATPKDNTPPAMPESLAAAPGDGAATLTWAHAVDASEYVIYDASGLPIGTTSELFFTVGSLTNGTSYTFHVKAKDAAGNLSAAASVSVTPLPPPDTTPPPVPTGLQALPGAGKAVLTWDEAPETADTVKYRIYIDGVSHAEVGKVTTYEVMLPAGGTYRIAISAVDASDNESAASGEVGVTVQPQKPAKPAGLQAAAGVGKVTLTWNAPPATDTVTVGYHIYVDEQLFAQVGRVSSRELELPDGSMYTITITAVNSSGDESDRSDAVTVTPGHEITVVLRTAAGGALPSGLADGIDVEAVGPNGSVIFEATDAAGTAVFRRLTAGEWTFRPAGPQSGLVLAERTAAVTLSDNAVTRQTVSMKVSPLDVTDNGLPYGIADAVLLAVLRVDANGDGQFDGADVRLLLHYLKPEEEGEWVD